MSQKEIPCTEIKKDIIKKTSLHCLVSCLQWNMYKSGIGAQIHKYICKYSRANNERTNGKKRVNIVDIIITVKLSTILSQIDWISEE